MAQEDVEVVPRLLGPFEQGDIVSLFRDDAIAAPIATASEPFFTPDFECELAREDVGRAACFGLNGLRAAWLDWLLPLDSYRAGVEDVIDAGDGRGWCSRTTMHGPKGSDAEVSFPALRSGRSAMAGLPASSSTGTAMRDVRPAG